MELREFRAVPREVEGRPFRTMSRLSGILSRTWYYDGTESEQVEMMFHCCVSFRSLEEECGEREDIVVQRRTPSNRVTSRAS